MLCHFSNSPNYVPSSKSLDTGSKRSLSHFMSTHPQPRRAHIWAQITHIARQTAVAVQASLKMCADDAFCDVEGGCRGSGSDDISGIDGNDQFDRKTGTHTSSGAELACFQIVGLDIMMDAEGRAFLLEANCNPSLSTTQTTRRTYVNAKGRERTVEVQSQSPVDLVVKTAVVRDALAVMANSREERRLATCDGDTGGDIVFASYELVAAPWLSEDAMAPPAPLVPLLASPAQTGMLKCVASGPIEDSDSHTVLHMAGDGGKVDAKLSTSGECSGGAVAATVTPSCQAAVDALSAPGEVPGEAPREALDLIPAAADLFTAHTAGSIRCLDMTDFCRVVCSIGMCSHAASQASISSGSTLAGSAPRAALVALAAPSSALRRVYRPSSNGGKGGAQGGSAASQRPRYKDRARSAASRRSNTLTRTPPVLPSMPLAPQSSQSRRDIYSQGHDNRGSHVKDRGKGRPTARPMTAPNHAASRRLQKGAGGRRTLAYYDCPHKEAPDHRRISRRAFRTFALELEKNTVASDDSDGNDRSAGRERNGGSSAGGSGSLRSRTRGSTRGAARGGVRGGLRGGPQGGVQGGDQGGVRSGTRDRARGGDRGAGGGAVASPGRVLIFPTFCRALQRVVEEMHPNKCAATVLHTVLRRRQRRGNDDG